jgi:hypothetical protein
MLKNWSRIALASFLVLMVGASIASATTARVRSLANVGDYISDDSAVNRWYSTLPSFGNPVNAEMGQWSGGSRGPDRTRVNARVGLDPRLRRKRQVGNIASASNEMLDNPGFWMGNPFYQNPPAG